MAGLDPATQPPRVCAATDSSRRPKGDNMRAAVALIIALAVAGAAFAQTGQRAVRGVATDIKNADIVALAKTMSSMPGGDELLKVTSINNGEYNVGVAVVHRAKAASIAAGLEHNQITEIYHIISGSGTMVSV